MLRWNKKDKTSEVVPERLKSPIDHKILVLIFGVAVSFQVYLYAAFPKPDDASHLVDVVSVINPLVASVFAFFVAKRYWGSMIFGKSYLFLAVGFAMNALGETVYGIYDALGYDTSFTIADILFYSFYPLILAHSILNIRFFKPKISHLTKAWVFAIPITITTIYAVLSLNQNGEANLGFYSGLVYVILSSAALSGTMLGARVFKQGVLGVAWLVLLIGVILLTAGDIWYSYLDTFDQYTLIHPVNLLWYTGYMIGAYALYKHRKII